MIDPLPPNGSDTVAAPSIAYGRSLPSAYYSSLDIYQDDVRMLGATQWLLVDHASRIARSGDYFLFAFGEESLIIVRDRHGGVHALFNVCRHRGSRLCLELEGSAATLTCPYHAWSYALDGRLLAAPAMSAGFDRSEHGLARAHVRVENGFIFVNLSQTTPPDFENFISRSRAYVVPHGFANATVARRIRYPTAANWKLLIENFLECYHCKTAHPTYCSVHDPDKLLAFGAGPGSSSAQLIEKFAGAQATWETMARAKGFMTGMLADDSRSPYFQAFSRVPVGNDFKTEALGGHPVAPLMGDYREYDMAQTAVTFNPLGHVIASSDHALVFRFTPRGPVLTDVEAIWLVHGDARAGRDYDPDALVHVWDVTLREDKTITENNQAGVMSSRYSPGQHSEHEARISDFVDWYARSRERWLAEVG